MVSFIYFKTEVFSSYITSVVVGQRHWVPFYFAVILLWQPLYWRCRCRATLRWCTVRRRRARPKTRRMMTTWLNRRTTSSFRHTPPGSITTVCTRSNAELCLSSSMARTSPSRQKCESSMRSLIYVVRVWISAVEKIAPLLIFLFLFLFFRKKTILPIIDIYLIIKMSDINSIWK